VAGPTWREAVTPAKPPKSEHPAGDHPHAIRNAPIGLADQRLEVPHHQHRSEDQGLAFGRPEFHHRGRWVRGQERAADHERRSTGGAGGGEQECGAPRSVRADDDRQRCRVKTCRLLADALARSGPGRIGEQEPGASWGLVEQRRDPRDVGI